MDKKFTPPRRDRRPNPGTDVSAAAILASAAETVAAPPADVAAATVAIADSAPTVAAESIAGGATEPAFAAAPIVTPPPAPAAHQAAPPAPAVPLDWAGAYLHAWLDCQREATQFLGRQLEYGRDAQRELRACDDAAAVARVQRDWSAATLKVCLDEAARVPVLAARFWAIGLSQLTAHAKAPDAPGA